MAQGSWGAANAPPPLAKLEKSCSWSVCQKLLWEQRNTVPGLCPSLFPRSPVVINHCTSNRLLCLALALVQQARLAGLCSIKAAPRNQTGWRNGHGTLRQIQPRRGRNCEGHQTGQKKLTQYQKTCLYSGTGNTGDNSSRNVFHLENKTHPFYILFLLNHHYLYSFTYYTYYACS